MKKILVLIAFATVVFFIPGCSKKKGCTDPISIKYDESNEEDDGSCIYAGTGGNVTIVAMPQHHTKPIISTAAYLDSAFVKFNAVNQPGTTAADYDMVVAGEEGEDHVHLEGLKPGKYFIYMTGFDTTITQRVKGGIPVTITATSGEVDQPIPVTE